MQNAKDSMFVLVEASQLSLFDKFMRYIPRSKNQQKLKRLLTEAIKTGLNDFWVSKLDPSFNQNKTGLIYKAGKMPAVEKSYNWWEEKAKEYMPERGSRLGTKKEYIAFLGVLIKKLVAHGWSVSKAWHTVCDDSMPIGNYHILKMHGYISKVEKTGSRKVCDFYDLANTFEILAWDKEARGFWTAGGCHLSISFIRPVSALGRVRNRYVDLCYSTGWIVLSKCDFGDT